jgi:hypothetical protein
MMNRIKIDLLPPRGNPEILLEGKTAALLAGAALPSGIVTGGGGLVTLSIAALGVWMIGEWRCR